ncbi:hypothetical protein [Streptomyces alboniger]|uniref:Uncharacterized protein n=1 Tax=Streptomyces alboniger TaxID=132473 RepID=A0A5J6HNM1_STRAD|nr:hypothetical protein [Streptomyces alboniger]QEV18747.1 hypothetical protein CP975_15725 [Streptomyces alboniger]
MPRGREVGGGGQRDAVADAHARADDPHLEARKGWAGLLSWPGAPAQRSRMSTRPRAPQGATAQGRR